MAEWKKVIVSGSNAELNNIFASGAITGSHISSSGNLFASLSAIPQNWVVTYKSESGQFHYTSSTAIGNNTIGTPSQPDATYNDGLLPFTPTTTIADAVDDINEVLAGLAPPAAPALDYIDSSTTSGVNNLYMGFSVAVPTSSYSPMSESITNFSNVAFDNQYATSPGSDGNRIRLGTFATATPITIVLNNDVVSNGSPFLNYPSNSFKANSDPTAGETYTLDLNGTAYTYAVPDSRSVAAQTFTGTTATITLTQAQTGSYPGTGNSFATFRHRTGSVSIPAATWRTGSNFARISSSIAGGPTTYIDWVFDPAAASGNFPYGFNNFQTSSVSATGIRWISGVPYYTGFSYNVTGSISNYYKNTYNKNSKSWTNNSSGFLTTPTAVIPSTPTTVDDLWQINSTHTAVASNNRLLSQSLSSTLTITNDFSKTGNTGAITTPRILLDNFTDTANNLFEPFILETRRVPSASYNTQADASTAIGTFPSASSLGSSDLLVYSSSVRYPTQGLNGGNFTGITYTTGSAPNYSGATGDRWYFRTFRNGVSANAVFNVVITGVNTNFVPFGTSFSGNDVKIWIKNPGSTGWRDISTDYPPSTSGIELNDNVGARQGTQPSNLGGGGGTATFTINLVTEGLASQGYFVIRIQTSQNWAGRINSITISGLS
jgi:hypothetical protein